MIDLSFIVSAYDRPWLLTCCLASLRSQTHQNIEVIVTDNGDDVANVAEHRAACAYFGATHIRTEGPTCYHSAEVGAVKAKGEYLCFPSDDSYYVPTFAAEMLTMARDNQLDLAYCEMIYNPRGTVNHYHVLGVQPRLNMIDKTGFLVRKDKFHGFPGKPETAAPCGADGLFVDQMVNSVLGVRHQKHPGILVVHN